MGAAAIMNEASHLVILSGCSGGGKSSLLEEMAARGYAAMPEPGRQIVREQIACGGDGLPWVDMARFAGLCIERGMRFHETATAKGGIVLFDRSIVDAVNAIRQHGLATGAGSGVLETYRYASTVFMTPPWEELFAGDEERKHGFADAVAEYEALTRFYPAQGYTLVDIPRGSVSGRADFLERQLGRLF